MLCIGIVCSASAASKDTAASQAFRLELALHWAPILYQDVDCTGSGGMGGRGDYITAINYDGEWNTLNNWENATKHPLTAHAYFSVVETGTHWYIVYAFYHPRDWADSWFDTEHENDLEGLLTIVERPNGMGMGRLLGVITVAHNDFYSFTPLGSPLKKGQEDIDGVLHMEKWRGRPHMKIAQQSKGHGLKAWPKYEIKGGDGVVYYPSKSRAEEPSHTNDRLVLYKLVDIFEAGGLWERRFKSETFAEYGKFAGDNGGKNKAHAPWKWDDNDDGRELLGGELGVDPAKIARIYFSGWGAFDMSYVWNPYLNIKSNGSMMKPLTFVPPHTRGDRDFDGNGPKIECMAYMDVQPERIAVRVYMKAQEWKNARPKKDYTTAEGWSPWTVAYRAPRGCMITHVGCSLSPAHIAYVDTDHETDWFQRSPGSFVQSFQFIGDTKGDEAGTRTMVEVRFNHLKIETKPASSRIGKKTCKRQKKTNKEVVIRQSSSITTGPSHARLLAGDWEIHTDDWTLLKASYSTRIVNNGQGVDLDITWEAIELQKNKNYRSGDTHIQSRRTIRIWQKSPNDSLLAVGIVRGGRGELLKYVRGETHGWHTYSNIGNIVSPSISFDGRGRNDKERQGFSGILEWSVKLAEK